MRQLIRSGVTILVLSFITVFSSSAQEQTVKKPFKNPYKKGRAFAYWGWNRGFFGNSTLKIAGDDYNLTLRNLKAHDRVTKPFLNYNDYFKLGRITIPQTNMRIGYFFKDNWAITLGVDHMKYVMDQNQVARVEGTITREGEYKGTYNGDMVISDDFLTFEHTDGLNYINTEVERYFSLKKHPFDRINIAFMLGGGAGILFPKTNAKFLDYERNDRFHVSGYGVSAKAGVEFIFFKHITLKGEAKQGFINMPNIILHEKGINGKGKQHFGFTELAATIGWNFRVHK